MEIVKKQAELKLFESLNQIIAQGQSSRCLHLRLSNFANIISDFFPKLLNELIHKTPDDSSRFFVCHDNDVFIINKAFTNRKTSQIIEHIKTIVPSLTEHAPHSNHDLASLFEINIEWEKLKSICMLKISKYELYLRDLKRQRISSGDRNVRIAATAHAEAKLKSTFSTRRNNRKSSEILIIEDDLFSQKLAKNSIGSEHNVSASSSGKEGLNNYLHIAPDLLFLDINLPDLTGHEVLKRVLEIDPDAYVIMLSGNGDKENVLNAMQQGAKGFIGKPFNKERLYQYINQSPFIMNKA
jgi:two-component system chemotaxis response regulator CheY